jgi:hypothetical protein
VKAREIFEYNKLTWPEMNDAKEETAMRLTRSTRGGLRHAGGWVAIALLLGATPIAAPPASAQGTLKVALQGDTSNVVSFRQACVN